MLSRRTLLGAGLAVAGTGVFGACSSDPDGFVAPDGDEVRDAETRRGRGGGVREVRLVPTVGPVDLGGIIAPTWSYGGSVPGAEIRLSAGEVLRATVANELLVETSVHWHGIALRNDADGVPPVTQRPVTAGSEFTYELTVPDPGTYWFHPHVGTQLDRGLYAPLIVEDRFEPLGHDDEWVVVLDDWLDGVTGNPDDVLAELRRGMGHMEGGHMMMGATSYLLGGDAGDVQYPHYLLNGRVPAAPVSYRARPGARVRLRIINAGGDTAFRVALGGHRLRVTHADGFPVRPVDTDALLIGMGERYDALVTLADGVFPFVAVAEGKRSAAFAIVRTGAGDAPAATVRPKELERRIVAYRQLQPTDAVRLPDRPADRVIPLKLTGGMMKYDWGFNGRRHDPNHNEPVRAGERVRLDLVNSTTMWHPVHLHGHTFAVADSGVRKDTVIVLPGQTQRVFFDADNPGIWMIHCHNIYHAEAGMMTQLGYQR
jgi:FtsP/CotA-like multicopper oxidase with cupredoxin domain